MNVLNCQNEPHCVCVLQLSYWSLIQFHVILQVEGQSLPIPDRQSIEAHGNPNNNPLEGCTEVRRFSVYEERTASNAL